MAGNRFSLGVGFFMVFAFLAFPVLAESCQWSGTVSINSIDGDSALVTAHRNDTGEFLASGSEGIEKGQYSIEVSETGSYITFRIMGIPADQEPQLCEAGESKELSLTASACTDCDGDGLKSLLWGGRDCDDRNPGVYPGAGEICGNGIDEDCDGLDIECPECEEDWLCTVWSECIDREQTRVCTDLSKCGTTSKKPAQTRVCEIYGAGTACNDGERVCDRDTVLECFEGGWRQTETCELGCSYGACNTEGITGLIAANPVTFYGIIVLIIVILAGAIYWKKRW